MTSLASHEPSVNQGPAHKARVLRRVRALELAVVSFAALTGSAMILYPGGTWYDPNRSGHAFFGNFLCDLLHARSLSGQDNSLGALLATLGMVALIPGLIAFVLLVPELVAIRARTWRALRSVAILACALLVMVPLLPSDRYGLLHGAAVLGAGVPATLALSAMVVKISEVAATSAPWRALSTLLLVTMLGSLGLFAYEGAMQAPTRILPVIARCATISLLIWLFAFAQLVRARLQAAEPRPAA